MLVKNLSKDYIRKASTIELSYRMNALMLLIEDFADIKKVTLEDTRQLCDIDEELKRRLGNATTFRNEKMSECMTRGQK